MATINVDSLIKFKHGTQNDLDTKIIANKAGESGTFYLTNDTHRLYVGLSDKTVVPVNEGIVTYDTLPGASENKNLAGQFAYIKNTGILAVHNGKQWVHLNPDTNTTYELSGFTSAYDTTTKTVTLISTLGDSADGSSEADFKLVGSEGVVLTVSGKTVTVHGQKLYATKSGENAFTVSLTEHDFNPTNPDENKIHSTVKIKTSGNLTVDKDDTTGEVILHAKADSLDGQVWKDGTPTTSTFETGFIPLAYDTSGNSSGTHIDPEIKYGKSKNVSAKFNIATGVAELDVYTKAEVDALKQTFDAMTYKGTTATKPSGTIANGDTWKATGDIDFTGSTTGDIKIAAPGDLIIARGTEVNGVIPAANLTFDIVPSGNEDTNYNFTGKAYGFTMGESSDGSNFDDIGGFEVVSGTDITVGAGANHDLANNKIVAKINHSNVSRKDTAATAGTTGSAYNVQESTAVDVVQSVTTSATGHVTGITTKKWTIRDTHAILESVSAAVTNGTEDGLSYAKTTIGAILDHGGEIKDAKEAFFTVKTQNECLRVGGSGTEISMSLVWGTF